MWLVVNTSLIKEVVSGILVHGTKLYEVFVLMSISHREGVACGQQYFMKSLF